MVVAVGLDVIELDRIEKVWNSHKDRFLERHFTEAEISYCLKKKNPLPSLAARFSAKEAFQKCWFENHGWRDVWVVRSGREPRLAFADSISSVMQQYNLRAHLSLTHSKGQAAAVVVLESMGDEPPSFKRF
ncbi:MAG: holo-ACP synthase [Deinococcota bacterium]